MSNTYSIIGIDEATKFTDFDLMAKDPTKWSLVDVQVLANGGRESVYQRVDGEPDYPATCRVGFYPNKAGGSNVSVKISTFGKVVHDDATIEFKPLTATLASTVPYGGGTCDNADYAALIQNLLSWMIPSVTGGNADLTALAKLQFGIVDIL